MRNHKLFTNMLLLGLGAYASTARAETAHISAPPVTVGGGVWLQRGVQGERTLLMSKVEGLEGELKETRDLQTQLADRLAQALEQLNRSETEQHSSKELRTELGNAQNNLKEFQYQLEDLESRSLQQERENIAVRQLLEKEKMILQGELQKQLHVNEGQVERITKLEAQLKGLDAGKTELDTLAANLKTKLEAEQKRAVELEDQVSALTTSRQNDEGRHRMELEKMTQSMADSQASISSLREEFRILQGVGKEQISSLASLDDINRALEERIEELEGSVTGGKSNLSSMEQELQDLRNALHAKQSDHLEQLETMVRELAALRRGESSLRDGKEGLQTHLDAELKKVAALDAELNEWKATADLLAKEKADRKAEATELQATLTIREKTLGDLQAQLSSLIEMGVKTNRAFTAQIDTFKEEMGSLKVSEIWFEAKTKELSAQVENEQGRYGELEKSLSKAQQEVISRDEQLRAMSQQIKQAQEQAQQREIELNRQLKTVQTDVVKIRVAMQEAAENLAAATAERDQLTLQVNQYENRLKKQKGQVNHQQELLSNLKQTIIVAEKNANRRGGSRNRSMTENEFDRITALTEKLDRHAKMLEHSREKTGTLEQALLRAEGELSRARRDHNKLQKELNHPVDKKSLLNHGDLQSQLEQAKTSLEKASSFEKHAREEIQTLNRTLIIAREQLAHNDEEIGKLTEAIKGKENEIIRLHKKREGQPLATSSLMAEEVRNLKNALQEKNGAITALNERLKKQPNATEESETLRTLQTKLTRAEREIKSYEKTTELLRKSIEDGEPRNLDATTLNSPQIDTLKKELDWEKQRRTALDEVLKEKNQELKELRQSLASGKAVRSTPSKPTEKVSSTKTYTQLTAKANQLHQDGKVTESMALYEQAIKADPGKSTARLGLAGALYALGNIPQAKYQVDELLKIEPNNPQALGLKSIIYWAEGDISQANALITQALKQHKTDPQLYNYYGIIAHSRDRKQEAIFALEKAIQLDPDHREAHFNLAVMYATMDPPNRELARRRYEAALNLGSSRDESLEQVLIP